MNTSARSRNSKRVRWILLLVLLLGLASCDSEAQPPTLPIDFDAAERTDFSQFGEDGVLEKVFEIIPPTNKYAVEFGAFDGITNSNTRHLILEKGWSSLQIEGDPGRAKRLASVYRDYPKVKTLQAWVYPGNIEILFEEAGVPKDLDLLVIDIDSNDYYVWRAIHDYRPKVVLIEANHAFPPPQLAVVEFHPMNYWDGTNYVGASIQSLYELGKKKGYEMIHVMRSGPNIIFVDAPYYERFGIEDNTPVAMYRPYPLVENPTLYPAGKRFLPVRGFQIPKKWVLDRY